MPQQQVLTYTTCGFSHWILNIGEGTNTSSKGEELLKIQSNMLLKKGDDSNKMLRDIQICNKGTASEIF